MLCMLPASMGYTVVWCHQRLAQVLFSTRAAPVAVRTGEADVTRGIVPVLDRKFDAVLVQT